VFITFNHHERTSRELMTREQRVARQSAAPQRQMAMLFCASFGSFVLLLDFWGRARVHPADRTRTTLTPGRAARQAPLLSAFPVVDPAACGTRARAWCAGTCVCARVRTGDRSCGLCCCVLAEDILFASDAICGRRPAYVAYSTKKKLN